MEMRRCLEGKGWKSITEKKQDTQRGSGRSTIVLWEDVGLKSLGLMKVSWPLSFLTDSKWWERIGYKTKLDLVKIWGKPFFDVLPGIPTGDAPACQWQSSLRCTRSFQSELHVFAPSPACSAIYHGEDPILGQTILVQGSPISFKVFFLQRLNYWWEDPFWWPINDSSTPR